MKKTYAIKEVCEACVVPEDSVLRFVSRCWILPLEEHFFDDEDLARIRLIHELQEHFGVNDAAVPIVLHLIDQLNRMHRELRDSGI